MKFSFLKNKRFLILVLVILILGAGGFFYWQKNKLTPPEEWDTAKVSPREDYAIKETPQGLVVENNKVGLSFQLPKGWNFEEKFPFGPRTISLASPNIATGTRVTVLTKGCRLRVKVVYIKTDFETLKEYLKKRFEKREITYPFIVSEQYRAMKVSGYNSVRRELRNKSTKMYLIRISFPTKQKVYEIGMDIALEDKGECKKEFDKILETVSIK